MSEIESGFAAIGPRGLGAGSVEPAPPLANPKCRSPTP